MLDAAGKQLPSSASHGLKVYFQDEGRFGRMASPASCWAPHGMRPDLPLQRVREYTYVYSAICPEDGDVFSLILPYSDALTMQVFIDEFSKHLNGQPVLLIMDQAPWHKTSRLHMPEHILLHFQPPYSPEVNPVEHFWEHIREKYTDNRYWDKMSELEDNLCYALRDASQDTETIKSLTLFDCMVYK